MNRDRFRFHMRSSCQIIGPSSSGKSEFIYRVIKHKKHMFTPSEPQVVIYAHSGLEQENLFNRLKLVCPGIKFVVGLEPLEKIKWDPKIAHILVIDDLYREAINSAFVNDMFFRGAHHNNIFLMFVSHNIFAPGKYSTDISRQSFYIALFRNKRDRVSMETIARNSVGLKSKDLHDIFKKLSERTNYPYLLIDVHPQTPEDFSLTSCITPEEYPTPYFHVSSN